MAEFGNHHSCSSQLIPTCLNRPTIQGKERKRKMSSKPPLPPSKRRKTERKPKDSSSNKIKTLSATCRYCVHDLRRYHTADTCRICNRTYHICRVYQCPHDRCMDCFDEWCYIFLFLLFQNIWPTPLFLTLECVQAFYPQVPTSCWFFLTVCANCTFISFEMVSIKSHLNLILAVS